MFKNSVTKIIMWIIAVAIVVSSCAVTPEDLDVDGNIYHLKVETYGETVSHIKGASGNAVNLGPFMSGNVVLDGKGMIPVRVIDMNERFPGVEIGDTIIIKTVDLKVIALPSGSTVDIVCVGDIEIVGFGDESVSTVELDECRMMTPVFTIKDNK